MRCLLLLFVASVCHAAPPTPSDCGEEIPGIALVAQAPVVLLGEMHGLIGPPELALDLACRLALRRSEAVLALDMDKGEQGRIDAYLASEGREADRAKLLAGRFWNSPFQDGTRSQARLDMFEHARRLIRAGVRLRVLAVVGEHRGQAKGLLRGEEASTSEKSTADAIVALAREKRGPVIMLVGMTHVQNAPDPDDPKVRWMGMFVHEQIPGTISLTNHWDAGDAWACGLSGQPPHPDCGRHALEANEPGKRWTIHLFPRPGKDGVNGAFDTGPARKSDPAIFLLRNAAH